MKGKARKVASRRRKRGRVVTHNDLLDVLTRVVRELDIISAEIKALQQPKQADGAKSHEDGAPSAG